MYIEQLYTNCLAEAAYYMESNGEAAIIDPLRETEPYIEKAQSRNAKIKYIFETHFHADFVSGHLDLADETGATIIYGPRATTEYSVYHALDNEEFKIGNITLKVLHTPGHTVESTCFLLLDENNKEYCIFTGDTLFVGDVGRPDLLDGVMTKEELASMMYDSLNNKIKPLPDDVIVYPGHGPGSSCGKNIGKETFSTIGMQKQTNYALQNMSKDEFINEITSGLSAPPQYFFEDAAINKKGYDKLNNVIAKNSRSLSVNEFDEAVNNGALILDTRNPDHFEKGFIPDSLNVGLNGMYAIWVGTLIDIRRPLVLITEDGKEKEAVIRLARVGYENVVGYLKGGIEAWKNSGRNIKTVNSIGAEEIKKYIDNRDYLILDVRKPSEYETAHAKGAINIPLSEIEKRVDELQMDKQYIVHCAAGYRSMIASSILKNNGIENFVNVYGGWGAMQKSGILQESEQTALA
jgi:glyoxylase-like metal-dependent hydrolase (beta-lactamase superfamily II)/rhodanese-related sulfurtransferase